MNWNIKQQHAYTSTAPEIHNELKQTTHKFVNIISVSKQEKCRVSVNREKCFHYIIVFFFSFVRFSFSRTHTHFSSCCLLILPLRCQQIWLDVDALSFFARVVVVVFVDVVVVAVESFNCRRKNVSLYVQMQCNINILSHHK